MIHVSISPDDALIVRSIYIEVLLIIYLIIKGINDVAISAVRGGSLIVYSVKHDQVNPL